MAGPYDLFLENIEFLREGFDGGERGWAKAAGVSPTYISAFRAKYAKDPHTNLIHGHLRALAEAAGYRPDDLTERRLSDPAERRYPDVPPELRAVVEDEENSVWPDWISPQEIADFTAAVQRGHTRPGVPEWFWRHQLRHLVNYARDARSQGRGHIGLAEARAVIEELERSA